MTTPTPTPTPTTYAGLMRMISESEAVVRLETDAVVRVMLAAPLTSGQCMSAEMMASTRHPTLVELQLGGYDLGLLAFTECRMNIPEARAPPRMPYKLKKSGLRAQ